MPVAQPAVADTQHGIPDGSTGQAVTAVAAERPPRGGLGPRKLERWHVALCAGVAVELKGRAALLAQSRRPADWSHAQVESDRATLWRELTERVDRSTRGDLTAAFDARDIELVRWYRLVQLRKAGMPARIQQQRTQQMDALFHALYAALIPAQRDRVDRELLP